MSKATVKRGTRRLKQIIRYFKKCVLRYGMDINGKEMTPKQIENVIIKLQHKIKELK